MLDATESAAQLESFLRRRTSHAGEIRVVEYEFITGGYSRTMAKAWVEHGGDRRGYVVRSDPPPGHSILDTDRSQEWAVLTALHGSIPMPAPLWFDPTGDELGSPAIVMDLVDGQSFLVASKGLDPAAYPTMTDPLCRLASQIHQVDVSVLPGHMTEPTSWDEYIDGRIQRWIDCEKAYGDSVPFMRLIAAWLAANKPEPVPLGLVHGDFQVGNVLIDRAGQYSIVDWELAHIGDPREDLGWWALAGASMPPDLVLADEDRFYAQYRELSGLSEAQVNPAVVAYFTLLSADSVYVNVIEQLALVAKEQTTNMTVAYMSIAVSGMHNIFMNAIARHEGFQKGTR